MFRVIFQDYPQYWQLGLQEPATHIMEQMIRFHNFINFHITYIGVAVCFLLFIIINRFNSKKYKKNQIEQFTHNSPLEIVWTLIPAFVLVILAVPSFTLLYIIEATFNPSTILKVIGHQWYWSYEYKSSDAIFQPLTARYNQIINNFDLNIDGDSISFFDENEDLVDSNESNDLVNEIIHSVAVASISVPTEDVVVVSSNSISEVVVTPTIETTESSGDSAVSIEDNSVKVNSESESNVLVSETVNTSIELPVIVALEIKTEEVQAVVVENIAENIVTEEKDADDNEDLIEDNENISEEISELEDFENEVIEDNDEENSFEDINLVNYNISNDVSVSSLAKVVGSENNIYQDYKIDSYMIANDSLNIEGGDLRLLSTDNHVVLPIHEEIKVLLTSADVLHSWAVPSFGIKVDACPGRLTQVPLTIKREGVFYGQCSEICGVNHGFMPITVRTQAISL